MTRAAQRPVLHLERPAFWTEPGDPEAWFRALRVLASQDAPQTGTPRTVAERSLAGTLAWRAAVGLFGIARRGGLLRLYGCGLVAWEAKEDSEEDGAARGSGEAGAWRPTGAALDLLRAWQADPAQGLQQLAGHLLRESPWLRLLLLRLERGDWALENWPHARASRAGLQPGVSLRLPRCEAPATWFEGLEHEAAGRWLARCGAAALAFAPEAAARPSRRDNLSLAPLTAPLHLLETVGWLDAQGTPRLPLALRAELLGQEARPAQLLAEITARQADLRGCVAAAPALRELLAALGAAAPDDAAFARWMDALVEHAGGRGALEIVSAEPGQARHGRGLGGDPARRLVRWVVHPAFDKSFEAALGLLSPLTPAGTDAAAGPSRS